MSLVLMGRIVLHTANMIESATEPSTQLSHMSVLILSLHLQATRALFGEYINVKVWLKR